MLSHCCVSLAQLKSVAAAHGIEAAGCKAAIIAAIEKERFRDEPQLRLTRTAENEVPFFFFPSF